eukprot:c13725_g1_i1.p1 GENE.c13725_g1_i1~~c13725_g1_i1.p1  ORF type:complete len:472 (+),score=221.47 c13725_g1_i1:23-1438(+)
MYIIGVTIGAAFAGFALLWALGANDVANAVGTCVGSKAITPKMAVVLAGIFEFLGASLMGSHVAGTIGGSIIDNKKFPSDELFSIGMFSVLVTSAIWITIGTWFGLPVSSTHTVLGGVTGVGMIGASIGDVKWVSLSRIFLSWIVSPLLGGVIAFGFYFGIYKLILVSENCAHKSRRYMPFFLSFVIAINVIFLIVGGPETMSISVEWYYYIIIFIGTFIGSILPSYFLLLKLREFRRNGVFVSVPEVQTARSRKPGKSSVVQPANSDDLLAPMLDDLEEEPVQDVRKLLLKDIDTLSHQEARTVSEFEFIPLMIVTACVVAFAHGGNDVANAIGPFFVVLTYSREGNIDNLGEVPIYVTIIGGIGVVIGLATWGYKVMETVGSKITPLTFSKGFAAQLGAGVSVLASTVLGLPISTTAVIVGSVMGVGLVEDRKSVNFRVIGNIIAGWITTLPVAALFSMAIFAFFRAVI